jgi:taurine dioxygenase
LIETRPGDLPDNDNWHTDVTFIETPPFGAVLTPRILPSSGGDTLWGSNVAAYDVLSAPIRKLLDGLTAEHSFETGFPRRRWGVGARKDKWEKAVAANPPVVHPVVRTIEGGQRGLFVNSGFTARILELTETESDACSPFSSRILPSRSSRSAGAGSSATWPFGTTGSALITRRSTTYRRPA